MGTVDSSTYCQLSSGTFTVWMVRRLWTLSQTMKRFEGFDPTRKGLESKKTGSVCERRGSRGRRHILLTEAVWCAGRQRIPDDFEGPQRCADLHGAQP